MFHTCAYAATLAAGTDLDVSAVVDDILTIQNSHFVLSKQLNLIAALAMSATLSRAKLASPSMRQIASPYIRPINVAALPGSDTNIWLLEDYPFVIPPFEEIQAQVTEAAGTTEPSCVVIWLSDGIQPMPAGNVIPLRWTSSTAAVANSWTTLTITFADTLPSGIYTIVDSDHFSTNARAHRWIISNQLYRPGMPSFASVGQRRPYALSMGQFGVFGQFRSNDLPRPQVLVNGTDASHEGYLKVIRTGNL